MSEIRKLPAQEQRVETGPVQFGDDWPGIFVRGDNAFAFCIALDRVLEGADDAYAKLLAQDLRNLLSGSDLTGISQRNAASSVTQGSEGVPNYEGRALVDGNWLPWHPISAEVFQNRQKWPRDGYEVRVNTSGMEGGERG